MSPYAMLDVQVSANHVFPDELHGDVLEFFA
jgi:hypothetical protein